MLCIEKFSLLCLPQSPKADIKHHKQKTAYCCWTYHTQFIGQFWFFLDKINGDETMAWLASKGVFRLNFLAKMGYKVTSSSSGSSRWSKRATLRFMSLKWIGFIDKILWKDKHTSGGRLGLITNHCLWK